MKKINLLPPEIKVKEENYIQRMVKLSFSLLVTGILLLILGSALFQLFSLERELSNLEEEIQIMAPYEMERADLEAVIAIKEEQLAELSQLPSRAIKVGSLIDEIQQIIPEELWLTHVGIEYPEMYIEGYTTVAEPISFFSHNLVKGIEAINSAKIEFTDETDYRGVDLIRFGIRCDLEMEGGVERDAIGQDSNDTD
ncbi:hypothetical protein GGQ84_002512 [Desulfitispora alkaliphila]|uniref:PilN domain-containing protein n=1 Tax=Desulfitispora alkaliphila TaxID=622674 RepID=UPI003D19FC5D